jgi:hypothetical protein
MCATKETSKQIRWHKEILKPSDELLRHLADVDGWKNFIRNIHNLLPIQGTWDLALPHIDLTHLATWVTRIACDQYLLHLTTFHRGHALSS